MRLKAIAVRLALLFTLLIGTPALAQQVWIQIEAQPTVEEGSLRARAYAGAFPDVSGYALPSGWFAILLGPYEAAEADGKLRELKRERLIPGDSFINDGRKFRKQFWPAAGETAPPVLTQPDPAIQTDPAPTQDTDVIPVDPAPQPVAEDETPEQAKASEAALTMEERKELQAALGWFGHYDAAIDGAFGSGTRAAMEAWQQANAAEVTGILTSAQRNTLLTAYRGAMAKLGLTPVSEPEAGIDIILPLAMVEFDGYAPPFVQYREKNGSGVRALLISEPGDLTTLYGLYDMMQSLEIVPLDGPRERNERGFEISGKNAEIESFTHVELAGGLVKGFTLVWPVAKSEDIAPALAAMKSSFRAVGDRALDPGLAPMSDAQKQGMVAGLDLRRPDYSRSGFFIDGAGHVLTTTDALQSCSRVTIDGGTEMEVALNDAASGFAVLAPKGKLSPRAFGRFQSMSERVGAQVALASYPYEDALPAPTLTFGTVEAQTGLNGEPGLKRLALATRVGDAGGPVLDGTGAVVGMLLPRETDAKQVLPAEVAFAATAAAIEDRLKAAGIELTASTAVGALPPEDLTKQALAMTVLVSCWK
ncbi:serine protease [Tabrizicola sp. J26]|uniref:serine protease n=1 Tax=Alitabrizicola rongguiensis TaxID=2909234 RepID=UPI001F1C5D1D|nr:serine protease [Tabrizicola rongguiensis]MCF1708522.1 serine protease [Tabrizicola rongguiensis]